MDKYFSGLVSGGCRATGLGRVRDGRPAPLLGEMAEWLLAVLRSHLARGPINAAERSHVEPICRAAGIWRLNGFSGGSARQMQCQLATVYVVE